MFKKPNTEFSSSILEKFVPDVVSEVGMSGDIRCLAYDAVQSLMAVGLASGNVVVFGDGNVHRVFEMSKPSPLKFLRFLKSVYLVGVDDSNSITVWALDTADVWARHNLQGQSAVSCVWTDPALDWLFLGLHSGITIVFDVDRGTLTTSKVDNLERIVNPAASMGHVQSVQLNPRDPGTLLICYRDVAVAWNLIKGEILFDLVQEFPLHMAAWHPSGSHIVTSHVNGQLTFWDGSSGTHLGSRLAFGEDSYTGPTDVAWCCRDDPIDTFMVLSCSSEIRVLDFGATPIVAVTSYDAMGRFFLAGNSNDFKVKGHVIGSPVIISEFRKPHYGGNHNPSAAIFRISDPSRSLVVLALQPHPKVLGMDSSILPPTLAWRSSQKTFIGIFGIPRHQWLGMMAVSPRSALYGGRSGLQKVRRQQVSTIAAAGFADGSIKLMDLVNADSKDFRIVSTRLPGSEIPVAVSVAGDVGEMAVAAQSGNIYLFTFKRNDAAGLAPALEGLELGDAPENSITNVAAEASPELHEGYVPLWRINSRAPVVTLCQSNVGFVAIGRADGRLQVVDRRGPAMILDEQLKGTATAIDFGIVVYEQDTFSTILMSVGTSGGNVIVYKLLPRPQGGIYAERAFTFDVSSKSLPVISVSHVDINDGKPATAVPETMSQLASGVKVPGAIIAATAKDARMVAVTSAPKTKIGQKLGSKSFDTPIIAANFAYMRLGGTSMCFVTVNIKGKVGIYGLPGLASITSFAAPLAENGIAGVTEMGDVVVATGTESLATMRIWGSGERPVVDEVFALRYKVPARPTISTVSWVGGRQFVKPEDLDKKLGGSRRSRSKRGNQQLVETSAGESETYARVGGVPKATKGWFSGGTSNHKHVVKKSPKLQKSWAQTLDEYYDSAEQTVNDALDEAGRTVKSSRSDASKSLMGGLVRGKLGL